MTQTERPRQIAVAYRRAASRNLFATCLIKIVNSVIDALWHLGVRHIDIPITPQKVWLTLRDAGVTE